MLSLPRPAVIKRILAHLERAASASTGRAPLSEATSSSAEGEASAPREPHYEPLLDDLPMNDLPIDDCPPDGLPLGDSA